MQGEEATDDVLPPLLPELVELIFLEVPVDSRLRCREVARRWHDALSDTRLWRDLLLGKTSGICVPRTPALMTAASLRAGGTLVRLAVLCQRHFASALAFSECTRLAPLGRAPPIFWDTLTLSRPPSQSSLDVSGWRLFPLEAVRAVAAANAGSLRQLHTWGATEEREVLLGRLEFGFFRVAIAEGLLRMLPGLCSLRMNLECESVEEALRVMGDEPLFAPLRIRKLIIRAHREDVDVAALAAAAAAHPSLKKLTISSLPLAEVAAVRALMDMAFSKLTTLLLRTCDVPPDALPELARLLGSPSLKHLQVSGLPVFERQLFVGGGYRAFAPRCAHRAWSAST